MKISSCFIFGILFTLSTLSVRADDHPAYAHALVDLRLARGILDNGPTTDLSDRLIILIDKAIHNVKDACTILHNGDNSPNARFPVDAQLGGGEFDRVRELLVKAHDDICMPESLEAALDARKDAVEHIDAALKRMNENM